MAMNTRILSSRKLGVKPCLHYPEKENPLRGSSLFEVDDVIEEYGERIENSAAVL